MHTHYSNSSPDSSLSSSSNHHRSTRLCVPSGGCSHAAAVYPTLVRDGLITRLVSLIPPQHSILVVSFNLQHLHIHVQHWQFPYITQAADRCALSLSSSVLLPHHVVCILSLIPPLSILHGFTLTNPNLRDTFVAFFPPCCFM